MKPLTLKKRKAPVTPNEKMEHASTLVEAQVEGFRKIADEVRHAMQVRQEAMDEAEKENERYREAIQRNEQLMENARLQNDIDGKLLDRVMDFVSPM